MVAQARVELKKIEFQHDSNRSSADAGAQRKIKATYEITGGGLSNSPVQIEVTAPVAKDEKDAVAVADMALHTTSLAMHEAVKQRAGVL